MDSWDPVGTAHVESIRDQLVEVGLVAFVRRAAAEVWLANRERHEPEELYDDAFTLSVQSSRNLANRLLDQVPQDRGLKSNGVTAIREFGATVLYTPVAEVRLVKAPAGARREPDFVSDFDWSDGEARRLAAIRNDAFYPALARRPSMAPLFEIPVPDAAAAMARCRDVFLVWAADINSGLTAGWIGLPTSRPERWVAVTAIWWDDDPRTGTGRHHGDITPGNAPNFGDGPPPTPALTLRPQPQESGSTK